MFHRWGHTSCIAGGELCQWYGPGDPSHAERATVSFTNDKVLNVAINAGTGKNLRFVPRGAVDVEDAVRHPPRVVRGRRRRSVSPLGGFMPNNGEAVMGFDLNVGRITTRFASFGSGPSRNLLRSIQIYCVPNPNGTGCP